MRGDTRINTIDMTPNMFFQMVHTSEKFWAYNTGCVFITSQSFRVITTNVFNTMPEKKVYISNVDKLSYVYKVWHYGLWSFQARGTKLERFLHKNQHNQRKLLNFENCQKLYVLLENKVI